MFGSFVPVARSIRTSVVDFEQLAITLCKFRDGAEFDIVDQ